MIKFIRGFGNIIGEIPANELVTGSLLGDSEFKFKSECTGVKPIVRINNGKSYLSYQLGDSPDGLLASANLVIDSGLISGTLLNSGTELIFGVGVRSTGGDANASEFIKFYDLESKIPLQLNVSLPGGGRRYVEVDVQVRTVINEANQTTDEQCFITIYVNSRVVLSYVADSFSSWKIKIGSEVNEQFTVDNFVEFSDIYMVANSPYDIERTPILGPITVRNLQATTFQTDGNWRVTDSTASSNILIADPLVVINQPLTASVSIDGLLHFNGPLEDIKRNATDSTGRGGYLTFEQINEDATVIAVQHTVVATQPVGESGMLNVATMFGEDILSSESYELPMEVNEARLITSPLITRRPDGLSLSATDVNAMRMILSGRHIVNTTPEFPYVQPKDPIAPPPIIVDPVLPVDPPVTQPTAYETAVANGYIGTEAEWLASQGNGTVSPATYAEAVALGYVGSEAEWLISIGGTTAP